LAVSSRTLSGAAVWVAVVVAGSGCAIRLGPKAVELKRSANPPLMRLGKVTEDCTGSWAPVARANAWGRRERLTSLLRQSEAASLFTSDPASLVMDIHLVSDHEDDGPRLLLLGTMSIATLGIVPLPYHSEWTTRCEVTLKTPEGTPVGEHHLQVKGTYDILAFPLTMFTLGAAGLRGAQDGAEVSRRMARSLAAEIVKAVDADHARLATWRETRAAIAEQQPLSVQVGEATYWVTFNIASGKEGGTPRRQYVLEIHRTRPQAGAAPVRSLVVGHAAAMGESPWLWRDPKSVVFYAERRLWYPEWSVDGPHARLTAIQFKERPVPAKELFQPDSLPELPPADWNSLLVSWKNSELTGLLRDASTGDLRDYVDRIEQMILRASEAAEKEKDEAQQLTMKGAPGAELHAQLSRTYHSRIEVLKPILAAIKTELANRAK
jgi:hypothetical protein